MKIRFHQEADFFYKKILNFIKTKNMKIRCLFLSLFFILSCNPKQKTTQETKEERNERMAWWRDATFGMFIHWGLYSIPAGEWEDKTVEKGKVGEWIMHYLDIPVNDYEKLAKQFNPTYFDAEEWVATAKNAGMKYIVITSKHHEGFALWDSEVSDYDIMDASPFKRDLLKELSDACEKAGIKLCFYHSIMDWHHPDAESPKDYAHQNNPNANWERYRDEYLIPQLTELVTKYKPAVLWFDGEWIPEWTEEQGQDLYRYLMDLDPNLIINNRIGKGRQGMSGMNAYANAAGDFGTPEQEILEGTSTYDWEACMTMNDTWGYRKDDDNWKSASELLYNLIDVTAKGGNYLLNVGPMANGLIPKASVERLDTMGAWLKSNGEAIYNTQSQKQYKEESTYFTLSADGRYLYAIFTEAPKENFNLKSVTPLAGSKISHLASDKIITWTYDSQEGLQGKFPEIADFGVAQTLKIQIK